MRNGGGRNGGFHSLQKSKEIKFGGKALNVAIGVKRLGGEVYSTGLMYNENSAILEDALNKENVSFGFVYCKGRVRENYKFVDQRAMLTEVNDLGEEVSKESLAEVLERVRLLSKTTLPLLVRALALTTTWFTAPSAMKN